MTKLVQSILFSVGVALLLISCGSGDDVPVVVEEAPEPAAPLHIISSFPATGSSARTIGILAPRLEAYLERPIEIHYNEGGRGGDIGARMAASAPEDQLTLFVGTVGNMSLLPNIMVGYEIDPLVDFRPVSQLTITPDVLIVNSSLGVTTLEQLVTYAQEQEVPLSYSHIAPLSIHRMEFLEILGTLDIDAVNDESIRGSVAAMDAVGNGGVDLAMTTAPYVAPLVEAGSVYPLAVANETRLALYPDVPTMEESGIAIPHGSWSGAFVPSATSAADTELVFRALESVLNDPEVVAELAELGMVASPNASPAAFRAYVEAEMARLGAVAQAYNVREE